MASTVIDIEALANKVGESSSGALSGAFQTDQSNVRDVTAVLVEMALRFHFDAEALYRHWDQEVFSEVTTEVSDFSDTGIAPSEFDWECLEAKIGTSLLFESTASACKFKTAICNDPRANGIAVHAMLTILSGDPAQATQLFDRARSDGAVLRGLPLLYCGLSAVKSLSPSDATAKLNELLSDIQQGGINDRFTSVIEVLIDYLQVKSGGNTAANLAERYNNSDQTQGTAAKDKIECPWYDLIRGAVLYWLGEKPSVRLLGRLQRTIDQATLAGVHWYAHQASGLLRRCGKQRDTVRSESEDAKALASTWLADLQTRSVDWQVQIQKINQLCQLNQRDRPELASDDTRLVWFIHAGSLGIELQARQQKKTNHGAWSKGRKLEWVDLLSDYDQMESLCENDRQLCSAIVRFADKENTNSKDQRVEVADSKLLSTLASHPRLYRANKNDALPSLPCKIELTQPHLEVLKNTEGNSATVRLSPYPSGATQHCKQWQIHWSQPDVLQVTTYKPGLIDIAHTLTEAGLQLPLEGLQQLQKSIPALSSLVTTYSDTDMPGTVSLINKVSDNTLHFNLTMLEDGLHIALSLFPLGEHGPVVIPGIASTQCADASRESETLLATIDGAMYKFSRNLQAEKNTAEELLNQLPMPSAVGHCVWQSQSTNETFRFISALQQLPSHAQVHWQTGQSIEISDPVACASMHVEIGGSFDWLHVDGELVIEQCRALDLDALFSLLSNDLGRYIQVNDTTVLELSEDLHTKLNNLRSIYTAGRVHPLATAALREAVDGMTVTGSTHWKDRLDRLEEAKNLEPTPPADLTATLRDYQLHGYQWMVRLAHWGAGACLADDMGLGKTFQAIAVVLQRSSQGPTLVTAPTSVCTNWINECKRFAPSLNVVRLATQNREETFKKAGAGDVIVCSYGVLQNEIESIAEIRWTTVVADEAQSFKNSNTHRSDAMMMLQSDFKLITTGTPIENRLEELWNLFRFINPELLGSRTRFKTRFANPIENSNDEAAREQLRALVRPFILRRLKSEVLTELPSRTEITQLVELEPDERAFYESMRTDASERIKLLDNDNPEQRFQVLAELTRLRRACCHPKLVTDEPPVESAKLRAFAKLVEELRAGGHRSLVFSQFVGHLTLIREYLDKHNISYQYLDGSTSVKQREVAVDKFQSGEGDLFLISLKAGNSGLNLTAADYVIHMDPWWNPAVEDQASDRAYRMGQTKPVTIYRLIVKGSIEEKIVQLHGRKRELSDGLLEGSDNGLKLSVDDLMNLVEPER